MKHKADSKLIIALLAFLMGLTAALYISEAVTERGGKALLADTDGTQLAQLFGSKSAATPTPKPQQQAAQDLKKDPPLDVTKVGDPLPRGLFIELGKLINPAVVSISTQQTRQRLSRRGGGGGRDPMREFFEDFWGLPPGGPRGDGGGGGGGQGMAMGSGFIISEDGTIITNNHVIAGADVVKVTVGNGDQTQDYDAKVLGTDSRTDIALIKINAKKPLPVAPLGNSAGVQVGEWVAAFGNPYGHAHTMTKGIVSAINREISELGNRFPFIQTDASINPGNSGGPLVNSQGYVIGVNTAIDARAQGIGFAIPIDNVKTIVEQLRKEGRVRRGYIGVGIAAIEPQVASQLGIKPDDGAIVTQVNPGSPASKAGIEVWDIIVEFGGKKVRTTTDLQNAVADTKIGSSAKAKIFRFNDDRKKSELNINVNIAEYPGDRAAQGTQEPRRYLGQKAPFDLGFKVTDLTDSIRRDLGIRSKSGPVITEVEPGSVAAIVGLQPGDLILDVNRRPTRKATDVIKLLRQGTNILRIARDDLIAVIAIEAR